MILSANEANRKSSIIKREREDKELQIIRKSIGDAIGKGEFCTTIFHSLSKNATDELQSAGYMVQENQGGMNETNTKIRW